GHDPIELGHFTHTRDRNHPGEAIRVQGCDSVVDSRRGVGLVADGEERQQNHHQAKANRCRRNRQERPHRIATSITADISEVFHLIGNSDLEFKIYRSLKSLKSFDFAIVTGLSGITSSTSRPLSRWSVMVARCAASGSWVTIRIVFWNSRLSCSISSRI